MFTGNMLPNSARRSRSCVCGGREGSIEVAVQPHTLQVVGPVGSLRLLQQRIAC